MDLIDLDYGLPPTRQPPPPVWDVLMTVGLIAPFVTVPVFTVGAAVLQDYLITGDGRSWQRAAIRMAIPTGLVTIVGLIGTLRVCLHPEWRRPSAVVGLVLSGVALLYIVLFTITA